MTSNNKTIIDGIDVSKCEYYGEYYMAILYKE